MFKVGEIIICTDSQNLPKSITFGKKYKVIRCGRLVDILNDKGWLHSYSKKRFITLVEDRRIKLEKICSKLEM